MAWSVVGKLLVAVPLVVLLVHYGAEFLAVDACLDSGGVYDYAQARCRTDVQSLPVVSYAPRYGGLLAGLVAMSLGGTVILLLVRRKTSS